MDSLFFVPVGCFCVDHHTVAVASKGNALNEAGHRAQPRKHSVDFWPGHGALIHGHRSVAARRAVAEDAVIPRREFDSRAKCGGVWRWGEPRNGYTKHAFDARDVRRTLLIKRKIHRRTPAAFGLDGTQGQVGLRRVHARRCGVVIMGPIRRNHANPLVALLSHGL